MIVNFFYTLCLFFCLLVPHQGFAKEEAKKLLFIMDKMNIGGTERSLINLLKNYPDQSAKLYVYLLKRGGELEEELLQNPQVQIIDQKKAYKDSYDVAISYAPWIKTSLWVDTIKAKRRIQWIHTDEAFFRRLERDISQNKNEYK